MQDQSYCIFEDAVEDPRVVTLLERHLAHCRAASPPEYVFALDLEALRKPSVSFWTLWTNPMKEGAVLCCGALQNLDPDHGEIKTMHTAMEARGRGVAAIMLRHIMDEAAARGITRLSLETGSMDEFAAARRLYERFGFEPCAPFADYEYSDYSAWYTRRL